MPACVTRALCRTHTRISIARLSIRISGRSYTTSELQKDILACLHHTKVVLPKILPPSDACGWSNLIGTSIDGLADAPARRHPRIAVWGADELSQPTEMVSALLDDPLVSDTRTINALRNRRRELVDNVLTIGYGETATSTARLTLELSWLRKHCVDIVEIPAAHPDRKTLLYDADLRIIVFSPLTEALPRGLSLESLLLNSASILVFYHPTRDQRALDLTLSRLTAHSPELFDALKSKILQAYPPKALSAIDTFRGAFRSVPAIEAFQTDFLTSGMTALSKSISYTLSSDLKILSLRHAQFALSGALEACRNTIEDASGDIPAVQMHIDELLMRIDGAHIRSVQEILGGDAASEVAEAIRRSTQEMRVTMDSLKWWKLPFKVDDLSHILSRASERAWCRDLEAKLQFRTGKLSALRSNLTTETYATLKLLAPRFCSAVLVNKLHQIFSRPPDLSPTTLTYPLVYRLEQLQYPILSLHRRAQRVVLVTVLTASANAGGTYAAWLLGWVTPPTAVGLVTLGLMAGIRLLAGNWEKEKKRWWEDWRRLGEGLERDLKEMLAVVIREQVTTVPRTAAEELSKILAARSDEIKEMYTELEGLEQSSRALYPKQCTSAK